MAPIDVLCELLADPDEFIKGGWRGRNEGRVINQYQVIADLIGREPAISLPANDSLRGKSSKKFSCEKFIQEEEPSAW